MMSSVSLPIIVIFGQHWNKEPLHLLNNLLPDLAAEGYDTLCMESPKEYTESKVISTFNECAQYGSQMSTRAKQRLKDKVGIIKELSEIHFKELAQLLQLHFSSKYYLDAAQRIKELPAQLLLNEVLKTAGKLSFVIKGVDINAQDYQNMLGPFTSLSEKTSSLDRYENDRIQTMTDCLSQLYDEGKGIIFSCGASHANNLMARFKAKNLQDKVLYYFVHSEEKYYDATSDEIEVLVKACDSLKGHTYCLRNESDRQLLKNKIINEIKTKNTNYREEVLEGNSQSKLLCHIFNVNVKTYMRPGYQVDALIDMNQAADFQSMIKHIHEENIQMHETSLNGHPYLVIPEINATKIAEKICHLKTKDKIARQLIERH